MCVGGECPVYGDVRSTPGHPGVGPVKLYWRYLEVYFGVNDIHRVILWPLLLCFCEAPSFALLVAASQQRNNRVDQALYEFHKEL